MTNIKEKTFDAPTKRFVTAYDGLKLVKGRSIKLDNDVGIEVLVFEQK